jgi:hypothetical protein
MVLSLSIYAHQYCEDDTYFNHLAEVNKEWLRHKDACPKGTASFHSDAGRIQLHLNLVIKHLRSNPPSYLNTAQRVNRRYLLARLQQYADQKVFPVNKYHTSRQPYFVDDIGTHCAVGQMISLSGHQHLVDKIRKAHNYDYIEDIKTEGIREWAIEFGFTIEELKWIQPAYLPTANIEQVLDGTNGNVHTIERNFYDGSLTIAGEFTELDNLPCLNIGFYADNQLTCLGGGVDGTINDVVHKQEAIYVFGELKHDGAVFPAAKYDGSTWNYLTIPNREGALCTAANTGGSGYRFEMAISHHSIPEYQEIWHFLTDDTWQKKASVKGVILDIIASNYGRVHVGHLDTVIVYDSSAAIDTTLTINNVLFKSNFQDYWYGTDENISDTVKVVKNIGGALIFGGSCSNQAGESSVCLSRYFNSTLQPLLLNNYGSDHYSINAIAYDGGNHFTFGGDFFFMPVIGTYGSNLATYNLVDNWIEPIALLDEPVNSLYYLNGELFIGGSFQTNLEVQSVRFLARQVTTVGTEDAAPEELINVYPNPFTTFVHVEGIENGARYDILSIDGRILKNGRVIDEKINGLDLLPKGVLLLRLESEKGAVIKKIIK